MADESYKLYYHANLSGRAEFIRMIFAETGVAYTEINPENVKDLITKGQIGNFPAFAPPLLVKGSFTLSQTPVICRYLSKKYGLWPSTEEDEWHAEMVNATIHDFMGEGCNAFHGRNLMESYYTQKEETKPHLAWFRSERLGKWLNALERILAANNGGKGFVIGNNLTYVDLALLHVLRAAEANFPEDLQANDSIPLLKAFKERIGARPNLQAYFKSDKCLPFEGNSMM